MSSFCSINVIGIPRIIPHHHRDPNRGKITAVCNLEIDFVMNLVTLQTFHPEKKITEEKTQC